MAISPASCRLDSFRQSACHFKGAGPYAWLAVGLGSPLEVGAGLLQVLRRHGRVELHTRVEGQEPRFREEGNLMRALNVDDDEPGPLAVALGEVGGLRLQLSESTAYRLGESSVSYGLVGGLDRQRHFHQETHWTPFLSLNFFLEDIGPAVAGRLVGVTRGPSWGRTALCHDGPELLVQLYATPASALSWLRAVRPQ